MSNIISDFEKAAELLKEGKIGIFPTDTAYGIGCRIDNDEAVRKIFEIRNRPPEKALLALVASIKMAEQYGIVDSEVRKIMDSYWPGGLTIILKSKNNEVSKSVLAGGDTLALRMPAHEKIANMIEKAGVPIVAPSANFSGMATPVEFSEVDTLLQENVDFVLVGMCTMKGVSTIIDATKYPVQIVREGVVKFENK